MKLKTVILGVVILAAATTTAAAREGKAAKPAEAMVTLSGKVTDQKTGETLTGVKVEVKETGVCTYTDFEGAYQLTLPKSETYQLRFNLVSYQSAVTEKIKTIPTDAVKINQALNRLP